MQDTDTLTQAWKAWSESDKFTASGEGKDRHAGASWWWRSGFNLELTAIAQSRLAMTEFYDAARLRGMLTFLVAAAFLGGDLPSERWHFADVSVGDETLSGVCFQHGAGHLAGVAQPIIGQVVLR